MLYKISHWGRLGGFLLLSLGVIFTALPQEETGLEGLKPAVVSIWASIQGKSICRGTGFFVGPEGLFYTAEHVLTQAGRELGEGLEVEVEIKAGQGQQRLVARLLKPWEALPNRDVALLKVRQGAPDLLYLELGDSEKVQLGDEVTVLGFPLPERLGCDDPLPTPGRVIDLDHALQYGAKELQGLFLIDTSSDRGGSGSPVLDARGRVIGILVAGAPRPGIYGVIPINRALAQLPLPLLVADFDSPEQCYDKYSYYINDYGAFYEPGMAYATMACRLDPDLESRRIRRNVIKISYDVSQRSRKPYSGFWLQMRNVNSQEFYDNQRRLAHQRYRDLSFYIRGDREAGFTTRLKVELKIRGVGWYYTYIPNYTHPVIPGVTSRWQRISIPLSSFTKMGPWPPPEDDPRTPEDETQKPDEFVLTFENGQVTSLQGTVYFDDLAFEE